MVFGRHQERQRNLECVCNLELIERQAVIGINARDQRQNAKAGERQIEIEIAEGIDQIGDLVAEGDRVVRLVAGRGEEAAAAL